MRHKQKFRRCVAVFYHTFETLWEVSKGLEKYEFFQKRVLFVHILTFFLLEIFSTHFFVQTRFWCESKLLHEKHTEQLIDIPIASFFCSQQ